VRRDDGHEKWSAGAEKKSDKDEDVWASSVDEEAGCELNEESHQERR
jgi:hypothetical protein